MNESGSLSEVVLPVDPYILQFGEVLEVQWAVLVIVETLKKKIGQQMLG